MWDRKCKLESKIYCKYIHCHLSLIINDIKPVSSSTLLVKYADDITVSIPVLAEDSNIAEGSHFYNEVG